MDIAEGIGMADMGVGCALEVSAGGMPPVEVAETGAGWDVG